MTADWNDGGLIAAVPTTALKEQLRIETAVHDARCRLALDDAQAYCELSTGQLMIRRDVSELISPLPAELVLDLMFQPVVSVAAVEYGQTGDWTEVDANLYLHDERRIEPRRSGLQNWRQTGRILSITSQDDSLQVRYNAGLVEDQAGVDGNLRARSMRRAILIMAARLIEYPNEGMRGAQAEIDALLSPLQRHAVATSN